MKIARSLILMAVVLMVCGGYARGQDNPPPPSEKGPSTTMAMNMMGFMPKQMVATTDGAVIILVGNKLLKYDKDLNLVKEVEITGVAEMKIDAGAMQDMIGKMKEKYGKHKDKSEPEQPAQQLP